MWLSLIGLDGCGHDKLACVVVESVFREFSGSFKCVLLNPEGVLTLVTLMLLVDSYGTSHGRNLARGAPVRARLLAENFQ